MKAATLAQCNREGAKKHRALRGEPEEEKNARSFAVWTASIVPSSRLFARYFIATTAGLVTVVFLFLFRDPGASGIAAGAPLLLALVPLFCCAYVCGPGPAALVLVIDLLALDYFILKPVGSFQIHGSQALSLEISFFLVAASLVFVGANIRASYHTLYEKDFALREGAAAFGLAHAFTRDLSGKILTWSAGAEQLYQWRVDEAVGKISHELLMTKFPKPLREIEAEILQTSSWHGELVHRCKDGREVQVASHWVLITDLDGSARGMLEVNNDISDLKRLGRELESALLAAEAGRAEAENANRAKDNFLNFVSHEIRNPMSVISLSVSSLRRKLVGDDPEIGRVLTRIETSSRILAQFVEALLDSTRIASGKLELEKVPLDVALLVREAVDLAQPAAQAKNISIVVTSGGDPVTIDGDPQRLHQILGNLLSNSIKYTPSGGDIRVTVTNAPETVEVRVCDNGQGICAEDLPHVFDRFWQAEKNPHRGGLGLGLYIVANLVKAHGGRISAFSEGHGRGTTFNVVLPGL